MMLAVKIANPAIPSGKETLAEVYGIARSSARGVLGAARDRSGGEVKKDIGHIIADSRESA